MALSSRFSHQRTERPKREQRQTRTNRRRALPHPSTTHSPQPSTLRSTSSSPHSPPAGGGGCHALSPLKMRPHNLTVFPLELHTLFVKRKYKRIGQGVGAIPFHALNINNSSRIPLSSLEAPLEQSLLISFGGFMKRAFSLALCKVSAFSLPLAKFQEA